MLESYPELNTTYHETNAKRKYFFYEYIPEKIGLREELKEITIKPPENGIATDDATTQKIDAVLIPTDQQPVTQRPNDVYIDVPNIVEVATISATGQTEITLVEQPRTYSDNALRYGLSMAIRLDTLWPQAWRGFTTNPLLGSGYATLTKASVTEFTEADSTDNNFLRVLGEVGLLGFVAFFGIICSTLLQAKNIYLSQKNASFETLFAAAYISGTIGLLLNAVLIDVFVSSKVAFTFWTVTGVLLAISSFTTSTPNTKKSIATKKSA